MDCAMHSVHPRFAQINMRVEDFDYLTSKVKHDQIFSDLYIKQYSHIVTDGVG